VTSAGVERRCVTSRWPYSAGEETTKAAARLGGPPAADSTGTRRRIVETARKAFATYGYGAATNRGVGAETGVTAGAIYYYFGSKLDLYIAVNDDVQERVYTRFSDAISPIA
jgi:AcrR family transcriptional regulator